MNTVKNNSSVLASLIILAMATTLGMSCIKQLNDLNTKPAIVSTILIANN